MTRMHKIASGGLVALLLLAANDAPTGAEKTVVTPEDTAYTVTLALFGYSDVETDPFAKVKITRLETVGSLELSKVAVTLNQEIPAAGIKAGDLKFVPVAEANGASYDSFDFQVHDGTEHSAASCTMTVDVTAESALPPHADDRAAEARAFLETTIEEFLQILGA